MKRFLATVVVIVVALGLSGCDQFVPEPLAFTLVGTTPVVRTCVPLTISSQSIKKYAADDDYEGFVVWEAVGSVELPAGTEFAMGEPLAGFTTSDELPADAFIGNLGYEMAVDAGQGGSWKTWANFDADQLSEGVWLDSWGKVTDTPCTHEECTPMASCFNNWPEPTGQPAEPRPTYTPTP